ncbi:hypothetical protein ESA_00743 [Cronobacter sakazakii ATCC BAA-894]|uniref:Uncharacterized protein n=1 Tax=Cronobacter sakazakii (strain ATCC BAA-894) TaxID=290339 RepID=A7MGV4_CROS8|nr:hypothetical protein ESA_00743 [Cronobacter sakazakii ATCC BAA-894]
MRRYILPQSTEKRTVIIYHARFFTQQSLRLCGKWSRDSLFA